MNHFCHIHCPKDVITYLRNHGFENPDLETKLILSVVLTAIDSELRSESLTPFSNDELSRLFSLWTAIEAGMPIQYLLGYTYVQGIRVHLSKHTLCPGPEIELLIDAATERLRGREPGVILDLCTGSGVIGVVLAKQFPQWRILGCDISKEALQVAEQNRYFYKLDNLILVEGDLFDAFKGLQLEKKVDLVIANPPYCRTEDIDCLPIQVREYAPRIAIDGGIDGTNFFRRIFNKAPEYLRASGYLVLEHERGQSNVLRYLICEKFQIVDVRKDFLNIPRIIVGQLKS